MTSPIEFDLRIGKEKPYSSRGAPCPFCQPASLTHILEQKHDMIWLMNKYPVFRDTWPTVLVETARHDSDLSLYDRDKLHEVIAFGLEAWLKTSARPEFRSVLYFRNFGPRAGGSQRHPHSQIIGLYHYDYTENISAENFHGPLIHENGDCYVTLSDYPICCVAEFNVMLKKDGHTDSFAEAIQTVARFVLNDFPIPCDSYNLFFYTLRGQIRVKIFPRYTASPLFMGYHITQIADGESRAYMTDTLLSDRYFGH